MHGDPSDIVIRELESLEEFQACVALQEETWGLGFSERVPAAILHVGQQIGGVTAGAFDGRGTMVGFVFGLTGVRAGKLVHWSDMLAVREGIRGRHIGERLKFYQRDKVRALGVETMLWTYDPLQARNAHFNINRLGAYPVSYRPDMYGSNTGSSLHGALPTDRMIVEWDLRRDAPPPPGESQDEYFPLANPLDDAGAPVVSLVRGAPGYRVQIPAAFSAGHDDASDLPMRWRLAVREAIVSLFASGYRTTRFVRRSGDRLPFYVFTPHAESPTA